MQHYQADISIGAPPARVWAVLTDLPRYPEWDSGVTAVEGEIEPGAKIKIWTEVSPKRAFPLTVAKLEEPSTMVWQGGMPFGLFTGRRTFTVAEVEAGCKVRVREEFDGPLLGLIWRTMPDLQPSFDQFVGGLKAEAERRWAATSD